MKPSEKVADTGCLSTVLKESEKMTPIGTFWEVQLLCLALFSVPDAYKWVVDVPRKATYSQLTGSRLKRAIPRTSDPLLRFRVADFSQVSSSTKD